MYVYHLIKNEMSGNVIYPLSELKKIYPELEEIYMQKYIGRIELMWRKLPILDCLWNDVIHLSTLHPKKTFNGIFNLNGLKNKTIKFVAIPVIDLDESKCVYFNPSNLYRSCISKVLDGEVEKFISTEYIEQFELSSLQIEEWKDNVKNKKPLLLFSYTRHLLYAGLIHIGNYLIQIMHF